MPIASPPLIFTLKGLPVGISGAAIIYVYQYLQYFIYNITRLSITTSIITELGSPQSVIAIIVNKESEKWTQASMGSSMETVSSEW